jgi:glyoxalase family protein
MRSVVLEEERAEGTRQMLVDHLGMIETAPNVFGFGDGSLTTVEVNLKEGGPKGRQGRGSVHHIAFRVADDETQEAIREELLAAGFSVSAVMNRTYFKSIYFREPGGALFEIATDPPGFAVDESHEGLGQSLCLPSQFEPYRAQIEKALPDLRR